MGTTSSTILKDAKVTLRHEDGTSFIINSIKPDSTDDKIYSLATSINSIQSKPSVEIIKTVTSEIVPN